MRRMHKQPKGEYSSWNFLANEGERYSMRMGSKTWMVDIYESNGRHKSAAGELSYRVVKKNGEPRKAVEIDGFWHWID